MNSKIITILGGSGFVGSNLIFHIAKKNHIIRVICRDIDKANHLKISPNPGQIYIIKGDISQIDKIESLIINSDIVINLVGILSESTNSSFIDIHTDGPSKLAKVCSKLNIDQLIHLSALGIDENQSEYAKSKLNGEIEILKNYPNAVIIRPSIIFGPNDNFFNQFAKIASRFCYLPLINEGKTKFQPIYIDDLTTLIMNIIDNNIKSKVIEAAGPKTYSFRELLSFIFKMIGKNERFVRLDGMLLKTILFFNKLLPSPMITPDQVESLKYDNIIKGEDISKIRESYIGSSDIDIAENYLKNYNI